MHSNNEVGTIEPIAEIGRITAERGVAFHTDAVQSVGKVALNVKELQVDMLSIAAHKLYGPKGIGALYIKEGIRIDPILYGGEQEKGLRSGTENVASIAGLGKACELAMETVVGTYGRNRKNARCPPGADFSRCHGSCYKWSSCLKIAQLPQRIRSRDHG